MINRTFRRYSLLLLLVIAFAVAGEPASARTLVMGLPQDCVPSTEALSERVMQLFTSSLRLGDSLVVYDAPRRAVIATVTIPADRPVFERPAVRMQQFGGELLKIRRFLEARCSGGTSNTTGAGNLFLPEFLDEISRVLIPTLPQGSVSVLLVGSAFYNDTRDPAFSMLDGRYPSDSHLKAKRSDSVFSTVAKPTALSGTNIHYCYTDTNWLNNTHTELVLRWWSLFVESQQGSLATFTGDLLTCFERFEQAKIAGAPSFKPDTIASDLAMLTAGRNVATREPAPPAGQDQRPRPGAAARPQTTDGSSRAAFLTQNAPISQVRPTRERGVAKIGIRWSCTDADLDIYARGNPNGKFLYFRNKETAEGRFPHDYTKAPGDTSSFEYVEFTSEIELGTMEAYINFYNGSCATGPSGIVRLWFDNKVYEGRFAIEAKEGNGQLVNGQMTGPHWTKIDVKKLANLDRTLAPRAGR